MSLLDFYSAFDVTDHRSLLSRLKSSHAICGTALAWFRSYLINHSQTVSAKGLYSPSTLLKYGVPQGSVLGRYCLSCIPNLCELSSIAALCCMNVSQMMHRKTSSQVSDLRQMIATTQDCISDLKSWMTQNKFQENEDKTELLLAILSRFRNHLQLPSSLCLNGTNISSSFLIRSLGVTLDPTLNFRHHISNICKTALFELKGISSLRHYISCDASKTLVCSFVPLRLDYCSSFLPRSPRYLLRKLKKIQNNAARVVFRSSKLGHVSPLAQALH